MADLAEFLDRLLHAGEIVFRQRPLAEPADRAPATTLLRQAFADYRLEIAGPRLDFHPAPALAAAELVRQACWFLVQHDEPAEEVGRCLELGTPVAPVDHLAADLVLRYLPQVHRRARARAPDDTLTCRIAEVLRQWPLSGVLSDVPDAPLTPLDFSGHPGLLLLYAERFACNEKSEWLPTGNGLDYRDLVLRERCEARSPVRKMKRDDGD